MKLGSTVPPLTCQLAIPASAGANSLHGTEHAVPIWIVQLATQSKSRFFFGTTSVVPKAAKKSTRALAPEGSQPAPAKQFF
jgi:hypothetical protein